MSVGQELKGTGIGHGIDQFPLRRTSTQVFVITHERVAVGKMSVSWGQQVVVVVVHPSEHSLGRNAILFYHIEQTIRRSRKQKLSLIHI